MPGDKRRGGSAFNASLRHDLEMVLAPLLTINGVEGVTIIDRVGNSQASKGGSRVTSESLYPFVATLAGMGHAVVEELEARPDVRVVAQSDRTRIHVAGINEDYLLVTVADNTKPWAGIRPAVNEVRRLLRERIKAESPNGGLSR